MEVRLPGLGRVGAIFALLASLALLACAGGYAPATDASPAELSDHARIAELRVTLSDAIDDSDRAQLLRVDVPMLLRVSALDWFEHESRFDREGYITLAVELLELSLAGAISAWLFRGLAGDDSLKVRVRVHDRAGLREDFVVTETTAVEGWEWRDADARLERMARRLGRRIAELL